MRLRGGVGSLSGATVVVSGWGVEVVEDTNADDFIRCLGVDRRGWVSSSRHAWPRWKLLHELVLAPEEAGT